MPRPAVTTRRSLLQASSGLLIGGVGAALVGGCTSSDDAGPVRRTPATGRPSEDDEPDVALLEAAIADEVALLAYCREAGVRHRRVERLVHPLSADLSAHVRAFRAALADPPRRGRPADQPLPHGEDAVLRRLVRLVSAAADHRHSDCLAAQSGLLARLFASASASHTVSLELLRGSQ